MQTPMLAGNFLLIFLCLGCGMIARRLKSAPPGLSDALNWVVIFVSLPALTLLELHRMAKLEAYPVAMAWIVFAASAAAFAAAAHAWGWSRKTLGALVLTAGLGNTSFVGFPLIEAFYGRDGLRTAILNDQPGSFLVLCTLGMVTVSICSAGARVRPAQALARIFRFPPFLAMIAALASRGVAYPAWLEQPLERLGSLLVPLALISVGFRLGVRRELLRQYRKPLVAGLVFKLALAPALIAALYRGALGLRGQSVEVTILEAAMAPMVTGGILASEYGLEPELTSLLIGVGIPLSLVTVPAWRLLLARL